MSYTFTIRSKPAYASLHYNPQARYQLMIALGKGATAIEKMITDAGGQFDAKSTHVMVAGAQDELGDAKLFFSSLRLDCLELLESDQRLLDALPEILSRQKMGFKLYAAGPEQSLWDINRIAVTAGLMSEDIQLQAKGCLARRVICVHCRAENEQVKTTLVNCCGCGLTLFVYDHFSRNLSGYMGFRVDAEKHGEIPGVKEVFK